MLVLLPSANVFADVKDEDPIRIDFGLTGSSVAVSDRNGAGMVTEIKGMVRDNVAIGGRVAGTPAVLRAATSASR